MKSSTPEPGDIRQAWLHQSQGARGVSNRAPRARGRTARGFTLIELMVVVAIIGVFSTMSVAYFPRVASDMRVSRAASVFSGMVREARSRALAKRSYTKVSITASPASIQLSDMHCPFESASSSCGTFSTVITLPLGTGDYQGVGSSTTGDIIFTPRGILESGAGNYEFYSTRYSSAPKKTVLVTSGGSAEKKG